MEENKSRGLGEPVDVLDLPTDSINDSDFLGAESEDTPFAMENSKVEVNTSYDPKTTKKAEEEKSKGYKYIPNAEATTQLQKFRELFGLKRIDVQYYSVKRKLHGNSITMTFGLRPLNHEDYQWIVDKSADIQRLNAEQLEISMVTSWAFYFKQATVAMSICTLDEGIRSRENPGTPVWKVFGIEPNDPIYTKDPNYPHTIIRVAAAEAMLKELGGIFYDVVEELNTAVTNLIDAAYRDDTKDQEEEENTSPLASMTSSS